MELSWIIAISACAVISLVIFFLLISMDTIDPLQYGITINKITKSIGSDVYENGRYIIGPFTSFIRYPSNLVTIEFSDNRNANADPLQTRTAEGLNLGLHVSFQYKLNKTTIPQLYNMTNINYAGTLSRISRDVILKVGGQFNATNYWTDRKQIGDYMKNQLNIELYKTFATCENLQVLKVDLPKSYEDSIVLTQVEVQKTNMRKFEQMAELIRQNISVIISQAEQQIKITNSSANAEAYRIKQFAQAKAINNTIQAEAEIYKLLQDQVGLKGDDMSEYIYLNSMMDQKNAKLLVGLQNSIVNFGNSPVKG